MEEDEILRHRAALDAAVESAYRVFARYRLGGRIIVCKCNVCVAPQVERRLIATPLRQLDRLTLAEYTDSAHAWDGRVEDDFRYFLPRYFELLGQGEYATNILEENVLVRLHNARYRDVWPAAEAAAVDACFAALLRQTLNAPISCKFWARTGLIDCDGPDAHLLLETIANARGDLAPYIAICAAETGREATIRLARMVSEAPLLSGRRDKLAHPAADAAILDLQRFLGTEDMRQRIEAACLAETDPVVADLLSLAEQNCGALMGILARMG